jgi:hypothetical protein
MFNPNNLDTGKDWVDVNSIFDQIKSKRKLKRLLQNMVDGKETSCDFTVAYDFRNLEF